MSGTNMSESVSLDRKPGKKTQVIPVTKAMWQSSESTYADADAENEIKSPVSSDDRFNVGMLDYMNVDEFIGMMKSKTGDNLQSLWGASTQLASQLKSSKSLLTMNSYMCMGKTKNEILEKLVDSMKFSLGADRVFICEFSGHSNALIVTHSDCICSLQQKIPISEGSIEADVYYNRKSVTRTLSDTNYNDASHTYIAKTDKLGKFLTQQVLCVPVIVDNVVLGVVRACRGGSVDSAKQTVAFSEQEESTIGYVTSNIAYLLKYSQSGTKPGGKSCATSSGAGKMPPSASTTNEFSIDEVLEWVVNSAYADIGCDRVSLFVYNTDKLELECIVSPDAVGTTLPLKTGIAGEAFRTLTIINVSDATKDTRHHKEVDDKLKYTTKSLLCAPVTGNSGHGIGVVQVINKTGGDSFTTADEEKLEIIAKRISILLQTKSDMQFSYLEKNMFSSFSAIIYQILSAHSVDDMVTAAKTSLGYLVDVDYVDIFDFDSGSGTSMNLRRVGNSSPQIARGNGLRAVTTLQDSPRPPESTDFITSIPKTILDCIRRGEMVIYNASSNSDEEFLPGFVANHAAVFPVGSKVFAGNPCKRVLVVARGNGSNAFSIAEKQSLEMFVELLGSAMQTVQRLERHDAASEKKDWELNMIVKALSLLHNYVMLLDSEGVVTACNKTMSELIGSDRKINTHISSWFGDDHAVLRDDILGVYSTGVVTHRDCVLISSPQSENGLYVSYQICPVSCGGDIHGIGERPILKSDIGAVIIVLHTHSNDEEGVQKLRQVLAAKASKKQDPADSDTSTASGTMNAVAQAVCEIGGRFSLTQSEQKEVNQVAANLMEVGRNMRVSMVAAKKVNPEELILVCDEARAIKDLFTWEFDVNQFPEKRTLRGILGRLFESMFDLSGIYMDTKVLTNFFMEAQKHYHDNPFHNFYHITCVTHFAYMLIKASKGIELLNNNMFYVFSIMLSAVVHDIDHPGNSNLFEINSRSELALLYNEVSVLENHHCSMAFRIMRVNNCDVLGGLPPSEYKDVKKTIVNCILATDMSVHFELIDLVKKKVSDGWDMQDSNDIFFLCRIILHASDLSNPVRPFHLAKLWAGRICAEFNNQVENEKRLGLPVLGFMVTPDEKTLCKNEIGFASFVVAPMWRNLELLFPDFAHLVKQLNSNLDEWKVLMDKLAKEEDDKKSPRRS